MKYLKVVYKDLIESGMIGFYLFWFYLFGMSLLLHVFEDDLRRYGFGTSCGLEPLAAIGIAGLAFVAYLIGCALINILNYFKSVYQRAKVL